MHGWEDTQCKSSASCCCGNCPLGQASRLPYVWPFVDNGHVRDLLKRYAKLALGRPFTPAVLNILVTSVCDMRCTHCFFTEELDDAPRKKLQMKTA